MVKQDFEITQKDGYANIVTTSDVAVQDFLCKRLSEQLPGSGFLCEESDFWELNKEYTWIIDPIDGTANYSRGIDQCAISVALKHGPDMEMGVVYVPWANELFHAEKGKGAFLNGKPIHVSDRPYPNAVLCTALPVYHKENTQVCADIIKETFLQINDVRRFGAAAPELCYLAMGRCELYFEYELCPWDFAAASVILTEAGGVITDRHGKPLTFTEKSGVVGGNCPESHRKLLDIILSKTKS